MTMLELASNDAALLSPLPGGSALRRVLVLGYGNPGREDDGLGPAAAAEIERMGWPNVTVCNNYQLVIEDVLDIAAADIVWFIDASRNGAEPYTTQKLSPAMDVTFTSHIVSPEALLAMAEQYYGKSPRAYLMGVRGYDFKFIERLSDRAQSNLKQSVTLLLSLIKNGEEPKP
jgi:hydrogenase maturation protease